MKTIGLIGGMSYESSKVYYEYINKQVAQKLGGVHSAKIIMSSLDFAEIEKLTFENNWSGIGDIVTLHAKKLEEAGADIIVLCTNTIHKVSATIVEGINIPFLHIADATGSVIAQQNLKKIGLLGTKFTMEEDFYRLILENTFGFEVVIPKKEDRILIQDIIYNQLVKGQFTEAAKNECLRMIAAMKTNGIEGVILGCTELPILIPDSEIDIPSFDTTRIHCEAAVELALNGKASS